MARGLARQRRAHTQLLAVPGRVSTTLGVMVVEHGRPAAYVVSGRIMVTSAVLDMLTDAEVQAVLARERAHAAGRHGALLAVLDWLPTAFPVCALFTVAAAEVARLVELRADEVAAGGHDPVHLARALVAVGERTAVAVPRGGVCLNGGDTVERLHRIMAPRPRPAATR